VNVILHALTLVAKATGIRSVKNLPDYIVSRLETTDTGLCSVQLSVTTH